MRQQARTSFPSSAGPFAHAPAQRKESWHKPLLALLSLGALALSACAAGEPFGGTCEVGADCESGACNDGMCVNPEGGSGGTSSDGGSGGDGGSGTAGSGGEQAGGAGGTGGNGLCSPNEDGTITREEIPLAAGLDAKFRVATGVTLSTASTLVDGKETWDFSGALPGDHGVLLETLPLAGTWYADIFPGASYASRLSDTSELIGVFEITDDALLLRGVVSPEDGVTRTELEYDPAVKVLAFPLEVGNTWSTNASVSGYASGVLSFYSESYESTVDSRGDVVTPFSTFDALRVRIDLTRTIGALVTTQKTFAFVTECFGTIATIDSEANETGDEFVDIAEIKRLAP